jgi:hypothetical protein
MIYFNIITAILAGIAFIILGLDLYFSVSIPPVLAGLEVVVAGFALMVAGIANR